MLNHVLLHQTVIGQEALAQFEMAGEAGPDLIVGCTGGGSNFAGLFFPFLREKLAGRMNPVIRAVEPSACPSFTRGIYAYDFGDTAGFTPLLKMHTLGHGFIPDPVHAGGLRYHGMSPLLSHMYELGLFEAVAKPQRECFAAAITFAQAEGIIPAPEPSHAIAAVVEEAKRCAETGEEKVILTALCGHGHFDMVAYERYLSGEMTDYDLPQDRIDAALANLPPGLSRATESAAPVRYERSGIYRTGACCPAHRYVTSSTAGRACCPVVSDSFPGSAGSSLVKAVTEERNAAMDVTELDRALRSTLVILARVEPDQLDAPTPCAAWDVRALINHFIGTARWWRRRRPQRRRRGGLRRRGPSRPIRKPARSRSRRSARTDVPGRMIRLPFGEFPGPAVIAMAALDQFTHGWDLARAIGYSAELDPELAAALLSHARVAITDGFRGPDGAAPFGPAVRGSRRGGAGRPARRVPWQAGVILAR